MKRTMSIGAMMLCAVLLLSGCVGGTSDDDKSVGDEVYSAAVANTFNSGEVVPGGTVTVAAVSNITGWNPNTPEGAIKDGLAILDSIYPHAWTFQPDGTSLTLNSDLMTSIEVVGNDPTVVEYVISDDAVWSDGVPISSDDFEYMWNVSDREICPDCKVHQRSGFEQVAEFAAASDGKSFQITFEGNFVDWKNLYAFAILPAHIAAQNGDLAESFNDFFATTMPTWSGGPYTIGDYSEGVELSLVPNPKWYGTPVSLDSVKFKWISDTAQIPAALRNKEIDVSTMTPQVDLPETLDAMSGAGVRYAMSEGMYFEVFQLNLGRPGLKDPVIRRAIFTALDRPEMISKTIGQFFPEAKPLGSIMIMSQQEGYENKTDDLNFGLGDVESAKAMLASAGYTLGSDGLLFPDGSAVPAMTCVFTSGNQTRQDLCEYLSATLKELNIEIITEPTDSVGETLSEVNGYTFDFLPVGYLGSPFIASNSVRFTTGQSMNKHNHNEVVDAEVARANASASAEEALEPINKADRALINDVWLMPLYQRPWLFAFNENVANVRNNETWGGLTYNVAEWGLRAIR